MLGEVRGGVIFQSKYCRDIFYTLDLFLKLIFLFSRNCELCFIFVALECTERGFNIVTNKHIKVLKHSNQQLTSRMHGTDGSPKSKDG